MSHSELTDPSERIRSSPALAGSRFASRAATAGIIVGALGGVQALVQLVVPPAVAASQYSYPLSAPAATGVQVFLFLHHVVMAALLFAVAESAAPASRLGRIGGLASAVALVAIGVQELIAITALEQRGETPIAEAVDAGYGVVTVLLFAALLILGIAVLRERRWSGWRRIAPIAFAGYVFLINFALLAPAPGPILALAVWSLLFVVLGVALLQELRRRR